jgi:NAD-dependent DNA ligase
MPSTIKAVNSKEDLELRVMAHRYLYYVACEPVLSDHEYDILERQAREVCPPESPVHGVGSSLPSSYTAEQIIEARTLT